jgi:pimeloyl-ACP methyl ester carboxylesterase
MPTCTTTDGVTIAYETSGDGPPLVLVHGITDSRRDWDSVVPLLAGDHLCVALDLRGHGESGSADDYGALAMGGDVGAVVAALDLRDVVLVGHSLGAVAVTAYAASAAMSVGPDGPRSPVASVVNVDQSLRFSDFADALRPLEADLRSERFVEALTAVFESMNGPMLSQAERTRLGAHRVTARQDVVLGVWDLVFRSTGEELDATAAAVGSAVTVPYLALHGLDPGPGYADWLTWRMPSATVELWPDHGHYPHLVDPERFAERIRTWALATAPGAA